MLSSCCNGLQTHETPKCGFNVQEQSKSTKLYLYWFGRAWSRWGTQTGHMFSLASLGQAIERLHVHVDPLTALCCPYRPTQVYDINNMFCQDSILSLSPMRVLAKNCSIEISKEPVQVSRHSTTNAILVPGFISQNWHDRDSYFSPAFLSSKKHHRIQEWSHVWAQKWYQWRSRCSNSQASSATASANTIYAYNSGLVSIDFWAKKNSDFLRRG